MASFVIATAQALPTAQAMPFQLPLIHIAREQVHAASAALYQVIRPRLQTVTGFGSGELRIGVPSAAHEDAKSQDPDHHGYLLYQGEPKALSKRDEAFGDYRTAEKPSDD